METVNSTLARLTTSGKNSNIVLLLGPSQHGICPRKLDRLTCSPSLESQGKEKKLVLGFRKNPNQRSSVLTKPSKGEGCKELFNFIVFIHKDLMINLCQQEYRIRVMIQYNLSSGYLVIYLCHLYCCKYYLRILLFEHGFLDYNTLVCH